MSDGIDLRILKSARDRIADKSNWCQGSLARNIYGRSTEDVTSAYSETFCAIGSIARSAYELAKAEGRALDHKEAVDIALCIGNKMAPEYDDNGFRKVIVTNDGEGHKPTVALFDAAIAREEAAQKE